MSRFFAIFFLMSGLMVTMAGAQDLIVTTSGDSLNCTVMVQNLRSVNFFYRDGGKVVTKEIQRALLKTVIIGFYNEEKTNKKSPVGRETNADSAKSQIIDKQANLEAHPSPIENTQPARLPTDPPVRDNGATSPEVVDSDTLEANVEAAASNANRSIGDSVKFTGNSRWYFGFRGGYANRLFRTGKQLPPESTKYLKELKSGYAVGASGGYFFWKNVALALNAELYKSSASMPDDSRDDAISINYIGSSLVHRKISQSQKSAVYTGFTIGYQSYSNLAHEAGNPLTTRGKAAGWGANVGLDFKISPRAAISFTASCLVGTIYKITRESGGRKEVIKLAKSDFEELSRVSLTVGLRFF